jgi:hypothetical protein
VINTSHEEPDEHTYTVHVEGRVSSDCTCPDFSYQEGACKHLLAVAIRKPVLEAATPEPATRTDGGVAVEAVESDHSNERPDDCDCSPLFEEPNSNVGEDE